MSAFVRIAISDYCPRDVCSGNRSGLRLLPSLSGTSALAIHSSAGHQLDHGDAGGRVSACQHTSRICEVCTRHPDNRVLLGHDHGLQATKMPTAMQTAATGAGAGVLNGSLGLGGPPVIVFFLGSPLALEAGRASIVAAFWQWMWLRSRFLGAWPVRTRVATSWRDELASAGVRRLVGRADCPSM